MIDIEKKNLSRRARNVETGIEEQPAAAAAAGSMIMNAVTTPQKQQMKRAVAGPRQKAAADGAVELIDESTPSAKRSAIKDINYDYIMWGHSQKVQLAGVGPSTLSAHVGGRRFRSGQLDRRNFGAKLIPSSCIFNQLEISKVIRQPTAHTL